MNYFNGDVFTEIKFSDGKTIITRGQPLAPQVKAAGDAEEIEILRDGRGVSATFRIKLTPEGKRAMREMEFYGKHLPPAPPEIERELIQAERRAKTSIPAHLLAGKYIQACGCCLYPFGAIYYVCGEAQELRDAMREISIDAMIARGESFNDQPETLAWFEHFAEARASGMIRGAEKK